MSKQELKELSQLADGEMKTFDLPCGSRITFVRRTGASCGTPHFEVTIRDYYDFAEVPDFGDHLDLDTAANPDRSEVRLLVLDEAIPTLRAIFGSLSNAAA